MLTQNLSSAESRSQEPVFKTKKSGKELIFFNHIHKHSFGGLGAYTLTCESTPFSGEVGGGGGGVSAFSKAELRFPIFFVLPPVSIVTGYCSC
jgi:hypothetical protein